MDNFTIINTQAILGTISILLGFKIWIQPRLSKLSLYDALVPFVFVNAFSYLGLSFMAKEQFYSGFPSEFLTTVGLWDMLTSVLAIITVIALKGKWKSALALVWIFNIVGFTDLITAFPQFFSLKLYEYDLGTIWLVFITYGLVAFLSHIYIFIKLIINFKKNKMNNQIKTTLLTLIFFLGIQNMNAQEIYPDKAAKIEKDIAVDFPYESKFLYMEKDTVHYVESGKGDPVLLLHGLPASSYLWRNVIPNLDDTKKVIALDFLGFGKSSFPKDRDVSIEVQYRMLTDFIEAKNLRNITLFIQDIGSLVGMLYAIREPENVKGIALFEAPFMPPDYFYKQLPGNFKLVMKYTRKPKRAERLYVKWNFVGKVFPNFLSQRKLTKEERVVYAEPFLDKERRYVMLGGPDPAQLSFKKGKGDSDFEKLLRDISAGMKNMEKPILYFYAKKGLLNRKEAVEYARENFISYTEVYLGKGKHFLTEGHPKAMSEAFNQWYGKL